MRCPAGKPEWHPVTREFVHAGNRSGISESCGHQSRSIHSEYASAEPVAGGAPTNYALTTNGIRAIGRGLSRSALAALRPVVIFATAEYVFPSRLDAGSQRLHHRPG